MIALFGGAFDPPHIWHAVIVKSILAKKNPEKFVLIPSSERNDKSYHVSDDHRLAMLDLFVREIGDPRVIVDDYFLKKWEGEMITRDVDEYCRKKYGRDIFHIFWADTIERMSDWDSEWYTAKVVKKLFVPREDTGELLSVKIRQCWIENFDIFSDAKIPPFSSTELRKIIPEYTSLETLYATPPRFFIPWLSKEISQYILEKRLYRGVSDGGQIFSQSEIDSASRDKKSEQKPTVLVHVCCWPDVTMPILALRDEYNIVCFWYDPNIQPKKEYDKRYEAFLKVCEIEKIPCIKWAYDVKHFFGRIKWFEYTPEKWEKCTRCYDMRMYVTAKLAKRLGIPYYTSSLNTSPKKDLEKLFRIGHKYAERFGIRFLAIPFRRRWGFEKSVDYTHRHGIYRQNYCGCVYSVREDGSGG